MAAKPVQFRDLATIDLESASSYYVAEADVATAIRFVDAVESTVQRIGRNPRLGSLRFAYELSLPDLRAMSVGKFPYLVIYMERESAVDVWRILHTSRDIPTGLREPDT